MNKPNIEKNLVVIIVSILLILIGIYFLYNNYDLAYDISSSGEYSLDTIESNLDVDLLLLRIKSYSNMFIFTGSALLLSGLHSLINIFTK